MGLMGLMRPGDSPSVLSVPFPLRHRAQFLHDLALRRKPAFLFLGEKLLVVDGHDEDAAAAADELTLEPEVLFDLGRQTGGPG
jgi:hypothetical protein